MNVLNRLSLLSLASAFLVVMGCSSPGQTRADQRNADQQRCAEYGYAPGTDAFADCMMKQAQRREHKQDRDEERLSYLRDKALERSGDDRYPICSAANMDAHLDTAGNFWYAEGCRAR